MKQKKEINASHWKNIYTNFKKIMVTTKSPTLPFSVLYSVSSALGPGPGFLPPPSELGRTGVSSLPARVGRCIPSPSPHPQACGMIQFNRIPCGRRTYRRRQVSNFQDNIYLLIKTYYILWQCYLETWTCWRKSRKSCESWKRGELVSI
jgi:hypothetical protein